MKQTRLIMGMPVILETADSFSKESDLEKVFDYFRYVDEKFSTYKKDSEISKINRGEIKKSDWSEDMKNVFDLSEQTKKETNGYFDILNREGKYDPSGLVKGWAILNAANLLKKFGYENFYVEAGGDIQVSGKNPDGNSWRIGIRNPFKTDKEIVKVVFLENAGIATSGTYERGQHIYNPFEKKKDITEIASLTVIGPNVYEADRFVTAAFAMGIAGISLIEKRAGLEGYMIDKNGIATMTSGFEVLISEKKRAPLESENAIGC